MGAWWDGSKNEYSDNTCAAINLNNSFVTVMYSGYTHFNLQHQLQGPSSAPPIDDSEILPPSIQYLDARTFQEYREHGDMMDYEGMVRVDPVDDRMVSQIRKAVKECSERGLLVASKWASELLLSIPKEKRVGFPEYLMDMSMQEEDEEEDEDGVVVARTYMDARQYTRAVHALRQCVGPKAIFMRVYCQFIASERKALREWHKLDNSRHQPPAPLNNLIGDFLDIVKDARDPWLLFLKALFLSRLSRPQEAIGVALQSIAGCPWNWSTWMLIEYCLENATELQGVLYQLPLSPFHPLVRMFQVKTMLEIHAAQSFHVGLCDRLLDQFPESLWMMGLKARVYYVIFDWSKGAALFDAILHKDPYHIDIIDAYSNVLYGLKDNARIANLAAAFSSNKNRPEVCCMIGNHYSLRGDHEKAVKYFKRATQLDTTYYNAWALMGHAYTELCNMPAAIESYRRAIDHNKKDYRSWYGLAQAYSSLSMPQYAVYYWQRASVLRPIDVSIWENLGLNLEDIGRHHDAIVSYNRALQGDFGLDRERPISVWAKLRKAYLSLEDHQNALTCSTQVIQLSNDICNGPAPSCPDAYMSALIDVADHHMRTPGGNLAVAKQYLERAATSQVHDDAAKAVELLKVINLRIQSVQRV